MMHSLQGFQSHLFKSMQSYLCNRTRVQPIIGLSSVIELCTDTKHPVYLCEACVLRVSIRDIKNHIMGSHHRYNYIKACHPYELGANTDLATQAWNLFELAKLIEKIEGTGNVQALYLNEDIFKEILSQPVLDVLAQLKQMYNQPNITEVQFPHCRTVTGDDYYNYHDILNQTTPSTPELSHMSSATDFSRMLKEIHNPFKTQSPLQCWLPTQILCTDRDTAAQSQARTAVHITTPCSPGYLLPNFIPNISPTTAFNSVPAAGAFQIGNTVGDLMQNVEMHGDKGGWSWGNDIMTYECLHTESLSSKTVQSTKPKNKRAAQWENNSLKVTITQKANPLHGKGQKSTQGHLTTLKLRGSGEHTPTINWIDDQFQINDYPRSEQPLLVGQENWQHPQTFTADDPLVMYENVGQYQQFQDHLDKHIISLIKHSDESPESYTGTQPLIGLHAVIKCQSVSGNPPCCYLCRPCCLKVFKSDIIQHLTSSQHYVNYIDFQYPHLSQCHSGIQSLEKSTMEMEWEEGKGQMEVRQLSLCLFNEVLDQDFHGSMKILNCGWTEEMRLNKKTTMKRSRINPDYTIPLGRSAEFHCSENGATGTSPPSRKRAN